MPHVDADSRVCWWLLLGFALVAPFVSLTGIPIAWDSVPLMDWQRLFEATILFCCMAWILASAPPLFAERTKSFYLWGLVLLLGLASTFMIAQYRDFALLEWSWVLLLVSLAAMMRLWGVIDRAALDRQILTGILISSFAYLSWFWYLNAPIYFGSFPPHATPAVSFPGFSNIRYFSDYQTFMLLLLPAALDRILPRQGLPRLLGSLATGAYFALAIIAGARSLLAAHLVLHSAMLLMFGRRYWPFLGAQLRFWLYGIVIFMVLTRLPAILSGTHAHVAVTELWRTDSSGRMDLWKLALEAIRQYPLLGMGPMHYASLPNPMASHPHNLMLQFASEWGVLAAALLMWLVGRDLWVRLNQSAGHEIDAGQSTGFLMSCALLAMLVQSMVAGTLNYPNSQVLALLCFAYPIADGATVNAGNWKRGASLGMIGIVALGLSIGSLTTLQRIRDRNQCYHHHPWPSPSFATRFWQQGWIMGPCSANQSLL